MSPNAGLCISNSMSVYADVVHVHTSMNLTSRYLRQPYIVLQSLQIWCVQWCCHHHVYRHLRLNTYNLRLLMTMIYDHLRLIIIIIIITCNDNYTHHHVPHFHHGQQCRRCARIAVCQELGTWLLFRNLCTVYVLWSVTLVGFLVCTVFWRCLFSYLTHETGKMTWIAATKS